jgi:hypothetical protein
MEHIAQGDCAAVEAAVGIQVHRLGHSKKVIILVRCIVLYLGHSQKVIVMTYLFFFFFLDDSADSCDRVLLLPDLFVRLTRPDLYR